jgi:hypothetical protein
MGEAGSPMWWTQMFAIFSNIILFGWLFVALFLPGLYDIIDWLSRVNLRIRRKRVRAKHGRVRQGHSALDDYTGSHHIVAEKEEVAS